MYKLCHEIKIGGYRLKMLESVRIVKSIEQLTQTATIVLPGSVSNKAIDVEDKIGVGDKVEIRLGYDGELKLEFDGYVKLVSTDGGSLTIHCEDDTYLLSTASVKDRTYAGVSLTALLNDVVGQVNGMKVDCDYEWKYDKFVVQNCNALEVVKKVKEECGAYIFVHDGTLMVRAPYAYTSGEAKYGFQKNVERGGTELEYRNAKDRKIKVIVTGRNDAGKHVEASVGDGGGDVLKLNTSGVSSMESLKRRAQSIVDARVYDGYSGSIQGWLLPYVEPGFMAELHDDDYPQRDGVYYVNAVETSYSKSGGVRKVELGKKIGGKK